MRNFAAICLIALLACTPAQPPAESIPMTDSGMLYIGGTVVAGPNQTPQKNYAIYTSGGTIREVGPAAELQRKYPRANVLSVLDGTILPGLTDAHGHLYGLGVSLDVVDLNGTNSYDEVIARVKRRAAGAAPGEWISGRGWDQNDWPVKEFPTFAALDAAIPDHPVLLERVDGHATLANSAAMRAAGVTAATHDPDGGRIIRDASGNPTGVFIDAADGSRRAGHAAGQRRSSAKRACSPPRRPSPRTVSRRCTTPASIATTITVVQELIDEKRFPIRVYAMLARQRRVARGTWFRKRTAGRLRRPPHRPRRQALRRRRARQPRRRAARAVQRRSRQQRPDAGHAGAHSGRGRRADARRDSK